MKEYIIYILKGLAVGIANIIPGVSGGTIALITGIFERLIDAIKAFDLTALKLLAGGKFKDFAKKTDLWFLLSLFAGIALAIVLLAKIFDFLFKNYPVYIWAYFFGLVLASIYFVGKTIDRWNFSVVVSLIVGTGVALFISLMHPATENDNFWYLILCGIVAICSMILPGLSGSYVLILMGNYQLVAINAINNRDITILLPVAIGAIAGLIAFSHVLSWVFKKFKDQTLAMLTGFILGSLNVLWPWKTFEYLKDTSGNYILKHGEKVVSSYKSILPPQWNTETWAALMIILLGIASISLIEWMAASETQKK